MSYINKGRNAHKNKGFSHNIYYPRINYVINILFKQARQNSAFRNFCSITGDIFAVLSIFLTMYIFLLLGSVL